MVGCALERVEWVRGVSFEPLNFAKFETVRGRWRTHPLTCIRLSPFFFLPFSYAPLRFSLPLFFSPQSSLPLRLFLPHPLSHPLSTTSPPRTARFAVPSQPSWYYGNFEPIRKSIVPARKPRGGLPLQPRSSTTRMYSGPERRCFLTRLSLAFPVILRHFGTGTGNTVCFDPRGGNKRLEKEKKRK